MKQRISAYKAIAFLAFLAVLAAALLWYPPLDAQHPAHSAGAPFMQDTHDRVNVNSAGVQELTLLPGIGPAKAESIVQYRRQHGDFRTERDLLAVSGIGEKTLEGLAGWICF